MAQAASRRSNGSPSRRRQNIARSVRAPEKDSKLPSIEALFDDVSAPAFRTDLDFVRLGAAPLSITRTHTRARRWRPLPLSLSRYLDQTADSFSFDRWDVDLQQYIPIFTPARLIALRAHAAGVEPDADNSVPFYLLPSLGGSHSIRAYPVHRFRDRNSLLLQAEYRFRLNDFMTGALFYDKGKVAAEHDDVWDLDDCEGGLRHQHPPGVRRTCALRARSCSAAMKGWFTREVQRCLLADRCPPGRRSSCVALLALGVRARRRAALLSGRSTDHGQRHAPSTRAGAQARELSEVLRLRHQRVRRPGRPREDPRASTSTPSTRCPTRAGSPTGSASGR